MTTRTYMASDEIVEVFCTHIPIKENTDQCSYHDDSSNRVNLITYRPQSLSGSQLLIILLSMIALKCVTLQTSEQ